MHNKNMSYRPDIDGLRAIAVLLVVLNHVGFSAFSGGYIGVDVFFVISGYLITSIISRQMERGDFSFSDFYMRRARRILPALYVVLLSVMAAGYYLYLPSDYSVLSQSTLSAIAFASNVFFWKNSGGYFSSSAEEMPLLHIWSLSVEEQFYFVWPLALILIIKLKSSAWRLAVIAAALVASFALAEIGVQREWSSTYFLLPSRAGELMVGAILAIWLSKRKPINTASIAPNIAAFAGLLMIIAPAFLLSKNSGFPGVNALIPCVGAALIIGSRTFGKTLVSHALSTRPLVFVGLISYSLYLWHWPLISFLRYSKVEITTEIAVGLVAASALMGYLSWRFVEQAFRHRSTPMTAALISAAVAGLICTIALPLAVYLKDGYPARFPYALLTQDQLTAERSRYWNGMTTKATQFDDSSKLKKVAVVGNSHAYDFSYALTENGFNGQIKLIETSFYCFNFSNNFVWPTKEQDCKNELKTVLESPELKTADAIYLHDNWGSKNLDGLKEMINKIRAISPAPIFVIGPKMIFNDTALNISKYAQQAHKISPLTINAFSRSFQTVERYAYDQELKTFFNENKFENVKYESALDVQCGKSYECNIISEKGAYLYFDAEHFTLEGSREFGSRLKIAAPELF
ncbi:acyltransferase [Pseudomonas sp. MF6751]|uniref:acyltransferase family protein n=1 Tax=Pseudomonas sp. MF6751 TaxID=2797528 RepID=UPI00190DF126|nr:acyltransferase family protein [Pseudomonas sp. MF6751]MBK3476904.1 acyltransferase [Pseudomonas sp. MF6751]